MHMETDDKCQVCGERFLLKAQLDRHMETEHKAPEVDASSEDASSDSSHSGDDESMAVPVPPCGTQAGSVPTAIDETIPKSTKGS